MSSFGKAISDEIQSGRGVLQKLNFDPGFFTPQLCPSRCLHLSCGCFCSFLFVLKHKPKLGNCSSKEERLILQLQELIHFSVAAYFPRPLPSLLFLFFYFKKPFNLVSRRSCHQTQKNPPKIKRNSKDCICSERFMKFTKRLKINLLKAAYSGSYCASVCQTSISINVPVKQLYLDDDDDLTTGVTSVEHSIIVPLR